MSIVDIILAILLPPVAVALKKGVGKDLVINILLWVLLFGIGGIIHAFIVLSKAGNETAGGEAPAAPQSSDPGSTGPSA